MLPCTGCSDLSLRPEVPDSPIATKGYPEPRELMLDQGGVRFRASRALAAWNDQGGCPGPGCFLASPGLPEWPAGR